MIKSTLTGLMLVPLLAFGADDDIAKAEAAKFEGTWIVLKSYASDGEEDTVRVRDKSRMTIHDGRVTYPSFPLKVSFPMMFNPSLSPKEIDVVMFLGLPEKNAVPPRRGIYRLDGDRLEIAWGADPIKDVMVGNKRPAKLVPCPKDSDTKWVYIVYHRIEAP